MMPDVKEESFKKTEAATTHLLTLLWKTRDDFTCQVDRLLDPTC